MEARNKARAEREGLIEARALRNSRNKLERAQKADREAGALTGDQSGPAIPLKLRTLREAADRRAEEREKKANEAVLVRQEVQAKKKLERMKKQDEREDKQQQREYEKEAKQNDAAIKKREARVQKEKQARQIDANTAVAGAAAAVIRGGGPGAAIGGGLGSAIGGRFGGPAGAIVGGAIGEKFGGAIDNAIPNAGRALASVAGGQGQGASRLGVDALQGASAAAAAALATIPGVGIPAAFAMSALGKSAGAAVETLNAFAARGRELAGYNAQAASAVVNQDVSRLLMDIKEGQQLGAQYAKVIEAQTKLELTIQAGLIPIKEVIMEKIPPAIDILLNTLIFMLEKLDKVLIFDYGIKEGVAEMKKVRALLEAGALPGMDAIFDGWLKLMDAVPLPAVPVPGPLDIPILRAP